MHDPVIDCLTREFSSARVTFFRDEARVVVDRDVLVPLLRWLRDTQGFDMLVDITCVDYDAYRDAPARFGLVYQLAGTATGRRLTVRTYLDESAMVVPTACPLWEGANWMEREVWDMFGVTFDGHPDHRRILLPDAFTAHPLRKDYPLQGQGERHHFPVLRRESDE